MLVLFIFGFFYVLKPQKDRNLASDGYEGYHNPYGDGAANHPRREPKVKPDDFPMLSPETVKILTQTNPETLKSGSGHAPTQAPIDPPAKEVAPSVAGNLEYVACFKSGELAVRDQKIAKTLFKIEPYDPVKPFQGWDKNKKKQKINGETYNFIRAQFPDEEDDENDTGWIADKFVKLKSECKDPQETNTAKIVPTEIPVAALTDEACCKFPLTKTTKSFEDGMGVFGYKRNKGRRVHAACDLYQDKNAPVLSVTNGTVIRGLYKFYKGTYAIEVKHQGGFVVRYGEVTSKKLKGVTEGKELTPEQKVGLVGKVRGGCCPPMLHFELYSGKGTGSLSGRGKYKRRSDLLNPTKYLLKWREAKFGK